MPLKKLEFVFNCSQTAIGPNWLDDDALEIAQRADALRQSEVPATASSRGLMASYVMRQILGDADSQIGNSNGTKMAIFSANDTLFAAILSLLGYSSPYGSHIAIEYWRDKNQDPSVRGVFSRDPLSL
jgi:hypothetical protein